MHSTPYEQRRYEQRHALDDKSGTRGVVPTPPGVGVDGAADETEESQIPGSMNSRCALCGTAMSTDALKMDPTGVTCGCGKMAEAVAGTALGGPGSGWSAEAGHVSHKDAADAHDKAAAAHEKAAKGAKDSSSQRVADRAAHWASKGAHSASLKTDSGSQGRGDSAKEVSRSAYKDSKDAHRYVQDPKMQNRAASLHRSAAQYHRDASQLHREAGSRYQAKSSPLNSKLTKAYDPFNKK